MHNPIPKRLRDARKKAQITQKNLGIKIGIDEGSASGRMNHYEQDRHIPDLPTLKRIAKELDVSVLYFFCESDVLAELVCEIEKLSEAKQKKLLISLKDAAV